MTTHTSISTFALHNLTLYLCSNVSYTLIMRLFIKFKDSDQRKYKAACITESCSDRNCNATDRDHKVKIMMKY